MHSRYVRHLADEAVGGRTVVIDLSVHRLYYENHDCPKVTFAEQITGLTVRHQRAAPSAPVPELGHRAERPDDGARSAACGAAGAGRGRFALCRGRRYGTLVVDVNSRLPIGLWDCREAEPLAAWLRAHPGIEAVCRDGSATYAARSPPEHPEPFSSATASACGRGSAARSTRSSRPTAAACRTPGRKRSRRVPGGRTAARTREPHAAVRTLLGQGMALRALARHLDVDRNVIRRYARAATWQRTAPTWPLRAGILTPYQGFLHRRWTKGEHNITALFREVAARGFPGSEATVCLYITAHRDPLDAGLPPPGPARSAFEVSRPLMTRPERLDEDQRTFLQRLLRRCPEMTHRPRPRPLPRDRLRRAARPTAGRLHQPGQARRVAQPAGYVTGLLDDLDAVTAGTTPLQLRRGRRPGPESGTDRAPDGGASRHPAPAQARHPRRPFSPTPATTRRRRPPGRSPPTRILYEPGSS
ncbi:ISL3 family transposase [Streptomyces fumigatiscleroticus]|nr:ISL3 family transposase [Streptomyces fumigatiscleroticus]